MFAGLLIQLASQDLDSVLNDPKFKGAIVGACVLDSTGKEIYAHNADLRMVPASNQKLITGAFALHALGPDYRPVTKFWKKHGTIYVDSTGDPLMTHDDLVDIRHLLKTSGNQPVAIRSAYGPLLPPGWEEDDLRNKYAAPVSAFSVDRSSFELWTEKGKLFFEPESYGAKAFYQKGEDIQIDFDPHTMVARVVGPIPNERTRLDTLAISKPDFAAASIIGGKAKHVVNMPTENPLITHEGKPLSDILFEDLPSSDNNISENLMLMAAGVTSLDQNPYQFAQGKVSDFLTSEVGLDPAEFNISDGSGLSRHNVITPRAIAKLLYWADQQPTKDLWHHCMAKPGEEGTLENRLVGITFEGKTGTMEMICALSGYLHLSDGRVLSVSILVNDYAISTAETRGLMDSFLKNLLDAGNGGTLFAESHNYASTRPQTARNSSRP